MFETGFPNPLDEPCGHRSFDLSGYRKVEEEPYDFVRKRLSVLVATPQTTSGDRSQRRGRKHAGGVHAEQQDGPCCRWIRFAIDQGTGMSPQQPGFSHARQPFLDWAPSTGFKSMKRG